MSERPSAGSQIGSLCTGYGGVDLAVELVLGGRLAWYAETDPHASSVLARHWPTAAEPRRPAGHRLGRGRAGRHLTAGFPCQDISNAGKRAGIKAPTRSVDRRRRRRSRPSTAGSSSWKTWPRSCGEASTSSTPTWPRSGTTRAGRAYAHPTSAPPTAATGCSCSPRPPTERDAGARRCRRRVHVTAKAPACPTACPTWSNPAVPGTGSCPFPT